MYVLCLRLFGLYGFCLFGFFIFGAATVPENLQAHVAFWPAVGLAIGLNVVLAIPPATPRWLSRPPNALVGGALFFFVSVPATGYFLTGVYVAGATFPDGIEGMVWLENLLWFPVYLTGAVSLAALFLGSMPKERGGGPDVSRRESST